MPIEDRLRQSPLIDQVVVVGQDQRQLGVLIVPDRDGLAAAGLAIRMQLLLRFVGSACIGVCTYRIFALRTRWSNSYAGAATPGRKELTNLMKLRRHVIAELHADAIAVCMRH